VVVDDVEQDGEAVDATIVDQGPELVRLTLQVNPAAAQFLRSAPARVTRGWPLT
jgi:hypothetical protein